MPFQPFPVDALCCVYPFLLRLRPKCDEERGSSMPASPHQSQYALYSRFVDDDLSLPSLIPSFLDDRESLFERAILHDDLAEPFHEGPQSRFGHSRDQFVEHAALAEERMGAMLGGVGLEMAVHAETFSGGAEQRQENDRE